MPLYERLTTTNKVLLYIPNLIDYLRAILMFISFLFMEKRPILFLFLYAACAFLDALDGYFARKYRQTSKVGSLLDLLIDMMATTCLVMYLATTESYKKYTFLFQIWVFFTITGHWAHQYASILRGDVSHKSNDENRSIVLRLYYKTRWGLALLVMMNEVFFMGLYVQDSFGDDNWYVDNQYYSQQIIVWTTKISFFFMAMKTFISAMHLKDAVWSLASMEKTRNRLESERVRESKLQADDEGENLA